MPKLAADDQPLISADTYLPEITLKAVILAILLAIILGAANAYLALKVGTTVAASIPASVIALGIFRLFKKSNVLETNLVQTSASAGEGLAAAATFILPALLILGYWSGFKFWQTTLLTMLGGILGVFFSVPLRRVLLINLTLPFPEGTAVGKVLRASATAGSWLKKLVEGGLIGGLIALCQTGFEIISSYLPLWFKSSKALFGITLGFDPTLIGAGYIIGADANRAMCFGMFLCWIIGVPVLCYYYGLPGGDNNYDQVMSLWSTHIRYIGVGTMIVGGIWTLCLLIKPLIRAFSNSYQSFKSLSQVKTPAKILRTEKDLPVKFIIPAGIVILLLALLLIVTNQLHSGLNLSLFNIISVSTISILALIILGFFAALICGYLVGLIGSTNTPLSGIMIIIVLLLSLLLLPFLISPDQVNNLAYRHSAIAIVIFVTALIGSTAVITTENIQDLKAGRMVGATPWKQQVMMIIGVIVSSIIIAPVLQLLFEAYGIGGVYPHAGMNPAQMLSAPQAALFTSLARGVLSHDLPWHMLFVGMGVGVIGIISDLYLKRRGSNMAVLAIGLGIYLPPEIITPMAVGGFIHYLAYRRVAEKMKTISKEKQETTANEMKERGMLLACGLVAGSALMGVILAIPFVLKGSSDALKLVSDHFLPIANGLGILMTIALCVWLYRTTTHSKITTTRRR